MGEGDGTVSLLSLGAMCVEGWKRKRWNPAGIKITTIEVPLPWKVCISRFLITYRLFFFFPPPLLAAPQAHRDHSSRRRSHIRPRRHSRIDTPERNYFESRNRSDRRGARKHCVRYPTLREKDRVGLRGVKSFALFFFTCILYVVYRQVP